MGRVDAPLDALQDIRRMMERSNRFISLSGISGIAAGICGLAGSWLAHRRISENSLATSAGEYGTATFQPLKTDLVLLALGVLAVALLSAWYFTWRRARQANQPLWNRSSRLLVEGLAVPLATGGILIAILLFQSDAWLLAAPLSLIFYGLSLVNGSKFTLSDIKYLGYCEIITGLLCTQFPGYGLYFWAFGFGLLHIIYGSVMWWKYERNPQ
ncbi:hypothetical protein SAMN05444008_11411 [Cnuella takakiae]|uniref:Uncharacterized protein n=1 Tax=Cnuella takakiae TaxID=1302690 RepID=A0A1M5FHC7_9BACT|nr:hypothetical protein [Cnuella takakiae]OLY93764.1 hypothetical protein BUE76_19150 [Cnuella takakiae]SHF90960.1 hypothetical protein SAMN05444008_11411 [Cnuella takakiae]